MIVPCIDLMGGRAVQLERGRHLRLAVDDVFELLVRFHRRPWLHLIDLDAAVGSGRNDALVRAVLAAAPMRVRAGGGVRTVARAKRLLDWGADQVIVGSRAFTPRGVNERFLRALRSAVGRRRVTIAVDMARGRVAVRGWRAMLPLRPADVVPRLEPWCASFLCTDVDREGTMGGADLEWFRALRALTRRPIIAAGGIARRAEVRALARLGMDAAVGMALYTGRLGRYEAS